MYNKPKQSYNKIYDKPYNNHKLIKIQEKRDKKDNNKYNYNYDGLCNIYKKSNNEYENKKINALALGMVNLSCEYTYYPFASMWCGICNLHIIDFWPFGKNISNYPCMIGNKAISVCQQCRNKIERSEDIIRSFIIAKIIYINRILRRLSLQDLYIDIVIDYFIIMLIRNQKSLRNIFNNFRGIFDL